MSTPHEPIPTEPAAPTPATSPPKPGPPPTGPTDPQPDPTDWKAEAEKWKKHSRENEARAKTNADAAARLAAIEDAQKTETEKLNERLTAAEARAAEATRQAVASKVEAMAAGRFADPQDAVDALAAGSFLTEAGTVDTAAIEQALTDLLERKPHWRPAEPGPRTPRPDPSQGPRPGGTVNVDDQIREAQSKGDWRTALRLQNSKLATVPTPK